MAICFPEGLSHIEKLDSLLKVAKFNMQIEKNVAAGLYTPTHIEAYKSINEDATELHRMA